MNQDDFIILDKFNSNSDQFEKVIVNKNFIVEVEGIDLIKVIGLGCSSDVTRYRSMIYNSNNRFFFSILSPREFLAINYGH